MPKHKLKSFKGQKINTTELKIAIGYELRRHPGVSYSPARMLKALKISNGKKDVLDVLRQLTKEGRAKETANEVFQFNGNFNHQVKSFTGKVDMTRSGAAYIIIEGRNKDIYVGPRDLSGAMGGDTVEVVVTQRPGQRKPEGRITKVIRRSREVFMGKLFVYKKYSIVLPFKAPTGFEINVYPEDIGEAVDGDIVVVRVTQWPKEKSRQTRGVITEVIGQENSSDMQMKSILIGQGFNLSFAPDTLKEAEMIPMQISDQEIALRRDYRDRLTFTIDPLNAKDHDDAISFKVLDDGNYEIGVHIADVSHYIKPGSPLDNEAYERSTSVYLVDRVLPMLPEKLSNNLCSLRPNEDKLTFSAVYIFDKNLDIVSQWFGKTVSHSKRAFTYDEVQDILDRQEGEHADELMLLNKIAKKLSKSRYDRGAINFESDEVVFRLDENGMPIELFIKVRKDAHMLVEDFMLLANRTVAEYIRRKGQTGEIPFVYRIHDQPNQEKLEDFAKFAAELGFKMDLSSPKAIAKSFNSLAAKAEEDELVKLITPLAIRTMSKAEYSTENIGHYGLAFDDYAHFTSPIRRYSDILAHRLLYRNLGEDIYRTDKEKLQIKTKHISAQERKAMEAERESVKYKQVEYMSQFIGQDFDGVVSGIHDKGIFVELITNMCEGMIRFDHFNEPFNVEDGKMKVIGRVSGRVIKMGDRLRVRVTDTNLDKRQIELVEVES